MSGTAQNAHRLRKKMTDAEKNLWRHLRGRQVFGHRFRRQAPIGRYIADFVCFDQKLIVEVDGGQHRVTPTPALPHQGGGRKAGIPRKLEMPFPLTGEGQGKGKQKGIKADSILSHQGKGN